MPGQGKGVRAITTVNVQSPGPQRLGNLPPVTVPAENPQSSLKILLGKQLYFDTRLSKDNTISCATCHDPAKGWSDAGPTSTGINGQKGGRRSPPVSNSAYAPLQFWDGRAQSLEEQAKGPVQNPIEMGNTHEAMLRSVQDIPGYVAEFEQVFGTSKVTVDMVAQAIAAFERTVVTTDSPFDRYVRGDEDALTREEKKGLEIFNGKGHCTACHRGDISATGVFITWVFRLLTLQILMQAAMRLPKIQPIWARLRPQPFGMWHKERPICIMGRKKHWKML